MNDQIAKIVASFDFQKVRNYMRLAGWTWGGDEHFPEIEELKTRAIDLLLTVSTSPRDNSSASCGGFHAHKWTWSDGQQELELLFAIEDAFCPKTMG